MKVTREFPMSPMVGWLLSEHDLRARMGAKHRIIIDAKGFQTTLGWKRVGVAEMILPGTN